MIKTEFDHVKVVARANIYYEGKVLSYAFFTQDGNRKTTGVIFPGEYEFGTGDSEIMDVTSGALTVILPGSDKWETFAAGKSFNIPANSKFKCKTSEISEYVCSYIKE